MSKARRWAHKVRWEGVQIAAAYMAINDDGEYVMHDDYAALEAECERLRADLRFLAEYIAAESAGHPLPNYLAVGRFPVDVARAALSAKPMEG